MFHGFFRDDMGYDQGLGFRVFGVIYDKLFAVKLTAS